jgi:cellulose synthase/poly-beta-1,6-N-acetylglucosamine synthase-like glycosyltransferase
LIIVGSRLPRLGDRGLLGFYGIAVLLSTTLIFYLAFVRYRDPTLDLDDMPFASPRDEASASSVECEAPLVSFFIPVNNEVDNIEACIRSVLASDYEHLELFVIDDGSDDGTREVLEGLRDIDPRLVVLSLEQRGGKKNALVHAARQATGSVFVFTDSDCVLAPDAISLSVGVLMSDPDIGGLSGHARALNADASLLTRVQDVWYDGQFAVNKAAESSFSTVTCVSGPLAAFRREAIINYLPAWAGDEFLGEPFLFATDRQLTAYVLGQTVNGDRLKAEYADDPLVAECDHPVRPWRIVYAKSARVWTNVPVTARSFVRQQVRWKKSFIRNLAFNGPWMWRRGLGPTVLYYGHALWVLVAPLMAFLHLVWWPLNGKLALTALYLAGVTLKGFAWAGAYRFDNRHDGRWIYRPLMTLISCVALSWLIVWAALTVRRPVWARG